MSSTVQPEFYWIAVALVTVVSAARLTRLLTFDKFPPIKYLREKFQEATDTPRLVGWQKISYCPFCLSPWVTAALVGWGYLVDFDTVWFLINGTFAASYLAALIQFHDGDEDEV